MRALLVLLATACSGATWSYEPPPACGGLSVRVERVDGVPGASIAVFRTAQDGSEFDPSGVTLSFPWDGSPLAISHAMTSSGPGLVDASLETDGGEARAAMPEGLAPAEAVTLGFSPGLGAVTDADVELSGCR